MAASLVTVVTLSLSRDNFSEWLLGAGESSISSFHFSPISKAGEFFLFLCHSCAFTFVVAGRSYED